MQEKKGEVKKARIEIEEGRNIVIPRLRASGGNTELEIIVRAHASLSCTYLQNSISEAESSHAPSFRLKLTVHEAAHAEFHAAICGSQDAGLHLETDLVGEGASITQRTLFLGGGKQKYEMSSKTTVHAKHCNALIEAKGVLNESASARFDGGIDILQTAAGANARLVEHTLLLSPDAKMNAIPGLHIATNDVIASHAAWVTRIDDEQLFYAAARGIEGSQAQVLIVDGFVKAAVDKTPLEKIFGTKHFANTAND